MSQLLQQVFDQLVYLKKVKNQSDFGDQLGYKSRGYINDLLDSNKDIPSKMQKKLHEVFGVSITWLATDGKEGSMFPAGNDQRDTSANTSTDEPKTLKKKIPVIGEALAGTEMEMIYQDTHHELTDEYIDVGELLKDSQCAFIVYGNSMTPAYPSGCVLGIRRNYDKFIQPGETYLLVTKSNRVFKRLFYNEDSTKFICYSDNTMMYETGPMKGKYAYPPFEIDIETDVIQIYDVVGMIKRNRNSGLIQRQK